MCVLREHQEKNTGVTQDKKEENSQAELVNGLSAAVANSFERNLLLEARTLLQASAWQLLLQQPSTMLDRLVLLRCQLG